MLRISSSCSLFDPRVPNVDAQQYRNLRVAARDKCDELTEKLIHAAELTLERPHDPLLFRGLSWLYQASSYYGNKPLRSLALVFLTFLIAGVFLFRFDLIPIPVECLSSTTLVHSVFSGWERNICDNSVSGAVTRSAVSSLQTISNPFGVLGARGTLIPNEWYVSIALGVVSVIQITLLAISLIGIRRRFRIS